MLRRGVHFILRVIEAHMAGLARLRLPGFFSREEMARMADVTGRRTETRAAFPDLLNFCSGFDTDLMAPAAASHPLSEDGRLIVQRWHRFHRSPRQRVLPLLELIDPFRMAGSAGFR